jgi:hypothetical protein
METFFSEWWPIVLGAAAAAYVFGVPLLILATFWHEANPVVEAVDPDESLPSAVREHLDHVRDCLVAVGFEPQKTCLLPQAMADVRSLLTVFANRPQKQTAAAVTIFSFVNNQWSLRMQYVEFSTRFRSGRVINTGNPQVVGAFPVRESCVTTHIPWISDPLLLYHVHEVIVAAKGDGGERELRLDTHYRGDPLAFINGGLRDELEAARDAGYLRLTADGGHYRTTLKGAYLMTWKQLPPFKGLFVRNRHRQVKRFLSELSVDA